MAAARRLVEPEDPTALSYVLSGLIQVELPSRQRLLEAATTELRLRRLEGLLGREIDLLNRDLKPLVVDARGAIRPQELTPAAAGRAVGPSHRPATLTGC